MSVLIKCLVLYSCFFAICTSDLEVGFYIPQITSYV